MKFHKNYDSINKCGCRTWAKMLTEDFLGKKKELRATRELRKSSRRSIAKKILKKLNYLLTPSF